MPRENAAVDRDVRSMERKQRVKEVLGDQFRNQLEDVVVSQKDGNKPMFHAGMKLGETNGCGEFKGLANIRKVNDLTGSLKDKYSRAERELRCKLAALYRLTAHFEWDHIIYSHITARLPDNKDHFLINPYGMQYSEITASSLIKIDKDGNIIDPGSTVLPVNIAGFRLNAALHEAGRDVVYHTHSHAGTAISAMKCGLLNLCQEALIVRPVSYGTYQGFVPKKAEQQKLIDDLSDNSNVIILENHGLVSVGQTIEEAFLWMAQLTKACEIQWRVLRCGTEGLTERTFIEEEQFSGDLPVELVCNPNGMEYGKGELEFESYMRMFDNKGFNTGYPYKAPSIFKDQIPTYPTVQYPPIVPGMDGAPHQADKGKPATAKQRSAWFRNTEVVEQRITPPNERKSKSKGMNFQPFDSVVSPSLSRASGTPEIRSNRMSEIEEELARMQAQYSAKPKVKEAVPTVSSDGDRSDIVDEEDLSEDMPILSRDVSIDGKMSTATDSEVEHDIKTDVEVRVGEDGIEIRDEITVNTVTTSIIEITEVQEEEFEVITITPGQLTDDQKQTLIDQGYRLQEAP